MKSIVFQMFPSEIFCLVKMVEVLYLMPCHKVGFTCEIHVKPNHDENTNNNSDKKNLFFYIIDRKKERIIEQEAVCFDP
jgi:hypothetical protein